MRTLREHYSKLYTHQLLSRETCNKLFVASLSHLSGRVTTFLRYGAYGLMTV